MTEKKIANFQKRVACGVRAITIAPDDKVNRILGSPEARLRHVTTMVKHFLNTSGIRKYISQYELYPDVSIPPLMTRSRVHFHGVIHVKDPRAFIVSMRDYEHYRIEIDTIDDLKSWLQYCKKWVSVFPEDKLYILKYDEDEEEDPIESDHVKKDTNSSLIGYSIDA